MYVCVVCVYVGSGLGTSSETLRRSEISVVTWSDGRQQCPIGGLAMKMEKRLRGKVRVRGSRVLSPEKESEDNFSRNMLRNQPLWMVTKQNYSDTC